MRKLKGYILGVFLAVVAAGVYIAIIPDEIAVEITNQEFKEKYIAVLNEQNIPFTEETDHLNRKWIIIKDISASEFMKKMEIYESWEKEYLKKKGVIVNES